MSTTILVRPLVDPVVDTVGHDPRSWYVELFWLPTLGPTSLLLLRRLAGLFEETPDTVQLDVSETSRRLGLGERGGRSSPLWRSLVRLVQFDLAFQEGDDGVLAVRRYVPPINRRHVRRLPEDLQRAHDEWVEARLAEPPLAAARLNARRLASMLTELGGDVDHVERTLVGHGFHPAICWESAVWARDRSRSEVSRAQPTPVRTAARASLASGA